MANKICGVYKITNLVNDKIYVGSSNDIYNRWSQHTDALKSGSHKNKHLQSAWDKYGENNFKFEIIEKCDLESQFIREQHFLNELSPFDENGYNIIRQISSELFSPHWIQVKCKYCDCIFESLSPLAEVCDDCKKKRMEDGYRQSRLRKEEIALMDDILIDAYGSYDDFWESVID